MGPLGDAALEQVESRLGTRFWIFPQAPFIPGYEQPDRVWLPISPHAILPGPRDHLMYVADPLFDKLPYGQGGGAPPFMGPRRPPAMPGRDGHFDHYDPRSRDYLGVHAYACVHFVLNIWQSFLGRPIRWYFEPIYPQLEIVPLASWNNAQAGVGFLELGRSVFPQFQQVYALNFDSIAHEVGHLVSLSTFGPPNRLSPWGDFLPFSEAFSDIVSLISLLYFDSAIERILRRTRGNLLLHSELNRFAETSPETQIRLAANARKMSETTREIHDRGLPFTGAVFDTIVELYHRQLVVEGAAHRSLLDVDLRALEHDDLRQFQAYTADAFQVRPLAFQEALTKARDRVGQAVALSLRRLDPNTLTFEEAAFAMMASADSAAAAQLEENFAWREIIGRG